MNLIVIAKEPVPGRAKTRLCPPCSPEQAASIAEAALADTLETVCSVPGIDPVVALDGAPGAWLPPGMAVFPQRGTGLAERLAAAFDDVGGPSLLIGMDTPQVTERTLREACLHLASGKVDAVLGPAIDGGWWAIGLRAPEPKVFLGVPMSTDGTLESQRTRLRQLGLGTVELATMRDVDLAWDAAAVATSIPRSRFAGAVAASAIGAKTAQAIDR